MENSEKKFVLENAIVKYVQQGYRVVSQTESTVQLIKPKQFQLFFAVILFFLFVIPFFLYLLFYMAQKEKTVYIVVNNDGKISVTDESGRLRIVDNVEQIASGSYKSIPRENDPGYSNSTKIMLAVLALATLAWFIFSMMNN